MRLVKIASGFVLLGLGIVMLPLPGPGWLTIALALALLATEFAWARRLQDRLKTGASRLADAVTHVASRRKKNDS